MQRSSRRFSANPAAVSGSAISHGTRNHAPGYGIALVLWLGVSLLPMGSLHSEVLFHNLHPEREQNLARWHPEGDSRCIRLDEADDGSAVSREFNAIFKYLNQQPVLFGYLMDGARRAGVAFCIDNRADGSRGYYDYTYNLISVREKLGFQQKTAIVLHELRHVAHVRQGYHQTLAYAMTEMVRMTFAVEADVQAFSTLFAWRLKEQGEPALWNTLLGFHKYADIVRAFESVISESGDELLAMRAAFIQWYASEWRRRVYFQGCCMGYLDRLDDTKQVEKYTLLPDNFFDHLCVLPDGRNYGCQDSDVIGSYP